jgi:hypothetical protein
MQFWLKQYTKLFVLKVPRLMYQILITFFNKLTDSICAKFICLFVHAWQKLLQTGLSQRIVQ